jgi:hypothetical protein
MDKFVEIKIILLISAFLMLFSACGAKVETSVVLPEKPSEEEQKVEKPKIPDAQREILNDKNSTTEAAIGNIDFKSFTYPLPRGWQDADSKDITLENGIRRMTEEKIGMSYVTTKFGDVTGDGTDEALVILKVRTGGSAIPQLVYIFGENKEMPEEPNLLWYFRTGDRADGGLKRVYAEDGELVVELFGRDRYIFTQMETSKIVGDEEHLCCPTHWTRSRYKKEGNGFIMQGDRWTYSFENEQSEPIRNMNEIKLKEERGSKK